MDEAELNGGEEPEASRLHYLKAKWLIAQGRYVDAEASCRRALQLFEANQSDGRSFCDVLELMATWTFSQGQYGEALKLLERAVEISREESGNLEDHARRLLALGRCYAMSGAIERSQEVFRALLDVRERQSKSGDAELIQALNCLAAVSDSVAAADIHERIRTIREKSIGMMHPDTARSLHQRAIDLRDQNAFHDAETLLVRALKIRENTLGPEHLLALRTVELLRQVYDSQGNKGQADQTRDLISQRRARALKELTAETLLQQMAEQYADDGTDRENGAAKEC